MQMPISPNAILVNADPSGGGEKPVKGGEPVTSFPSVLTDSRTVMHDGGGDAFTPALAKGPDAGAMLRPVGGINRLLNPVVSQNANVANHRNPGPVPLVPQKMTSPGLVGTEEDTGQKAVVEAPAGLRAEISRQGITGPGRAATGKLAEVPTGATGGDTGQETLRDRRQDTKGGAKVAASGNGSAEAVIAMSEESRLDGQSEEPAVPDSAFVAALVTARGPAAGYPVEAPPVSADAPQRVRAVPENQVETGQSLAENRMYQNGATGVSGSNLRAPSFVEPIVHPSTRDKPRAFEQATSAPVPSGSSIALVSSPEVASAAQSVGVPDTSRQALDRGLSSGEAKPDGRPGIASRSEAPLSPRSDVVAQAPVSQVLGPGHGGSQPALGEAPKGSAAQAPPQNASLREGLELLDKGGAKPVGDRAAAGRPDRTAAPPGVAVGPALKAGPGAREILAPDQGYAPQTAPREPPKGQNARAVRERLAPADVERASQSAVAQGGQETLVQSRIRQPGAQAGAETDPRLSVGRTGTKTDREGIVDNGREGNTRTANAAAPQIQEGRRGDIAVDRPTGERTALERLPGSGETRPPGLEEKIFDTTPGSEVPQALGESSRPGRPSPGSAALQSAPSEPALARHISSQIAELARRPADAPVELTLSPEELGRVRLIMRMEHGSLNLSVVAERAETQDLLRRHIDMLAQELRQIGYRDVSFGFGTDGGARHGAGLGGQNSATGDAVHSAGVHVPADSDALLTAPERMPLPPTGRVDIRL